MLRSLRHFWALHLAVVLAAAVAGTVVTGSLVVGDSVHGSLRALFLDRLGATESAVVAARPFRAALAAEVARHLPKSATVAPILLLPGSAARAAAGPPDAAPPVRATVVGYDERFAALYPAEALGKRAAGDRGPEPGPAGKPEIRFPPVLINRTLAGAVGAATGDDLLLTFEQPSTIPRDALLGHKDSESVVASGRFTVAAILPDRGAGGFGLAIGQAIPANVFVPLGTLQRRTGLAGQANVLLVAAGAGRGAVRQAIRRSVDLADLGLALRPAPEPGAAALVLDSRDFFLPAAAESAAAAAAAALHARAERVFTYLATALRAHGRLAPYSMVAAIDPLPPLPPLPMLPTLPAAGGLRTAAGAPLPPLAGGEIVLDAWAAEALQAVPGDAVEMRWLLAEPASAGQPSASAGASFRLRGIAAMDGLAADRTLTPALPGIDAAPDIASWSAPFPIDLHLVGPRDEAYWHRYGATPKAFVPLSTGRRLWSSRFGDLTSVRIAFPSPAAASALAEPLRRDLLARLPLAPFGFEPREIRAEGLSAADAGTDFTSLFLGFSSFLIAAAVLLTGLVFSLGLERRRREIGLLLALGFPLARVRRRFLAEGAALAALGALAGLAGACGFAALQMRGLGLWWRPAVGTPYLRLVVQPATLAAGFLASVGVVLVAIVAGVRRAGRLPATALLAGATGRGGPLAGAGRGSRGRPGRGLLLAFWGSAATGLALAGWLAAIRSTGRPQPGLAFGLGACLLAAGASGFAVACRRAGNRESERGGLAALALRDTAAAPGRGVLSIGLVACACFALVMVAANRREERQRPDWAGFTLLAESQVPLYQDLGSPAGREALGIPPQAEALLAASSIVGLREVAGDDASCLNLYLPRRPRLLGLPPALLARRDVAFAGALGPPPGSLTLLLGDERDGALPAVGDEQSVRWILHHGLGDEIPLDGAAGRRLRLVGLLAGSPLQGALLVSERNLLRAFPALGGRRVFLLRPPRGREREVSRILTAALGDLGFAVTPIAERLALFHDVESTYLAIFQALGSLGLLLGTLGLGIELVRSAVARRGELAILRAFGFGRRRLAALLLLENGLLLAAGLALGTGAGLLAAALGGGEPGPFPWGPLAATLGGIFACGLAACAAAVWTAVGGPLAALLKAEA